MNPKTLNSLNALFFVVLILLTSLSTDLFTLIYHCVIMQ